MKKVTIVIGENGIEACQSCGDNPDEEEFIQKEIIDLIRPELDRINLRLNETGE